MTMQPTGHLDPFTRDRLPPREQWPDFRFDLAGLDYPARLNCGADLLDGAVAKGWGERMAVHCGDCSLSYAELLAAANRIANYLVTVLGVVPGNRVLLHGPNGIDLMAAWYAVMKVGAVAVTTMPMLRAGELAKVIAKGEVGFALCDQALVEPVREAASDVPVLASITGWGPGSAFETALAAMPTHFENADTARDDVALLAFTSGTTGQPKACAHFHSSVLAMADTFARHTLAPTPDEIYTGTPPFAFTFGLGAFVVFPARFGLAVALPERPGFEALCETIERFRATTLFTAPMGYRALMASWSDHDLSSLRKGISAGEHLPKATSDAFFACSGIRLIDGIGATELIHIFISESGEDIHPGATGRAVPGYQARVIDEAGRDLPDGEVGRLAVRGPTGCLYLDDARQAGYVSNGWNVTGDLYRRDADGRFWYFSRADDLIVASGYNIAAPEVEQALLTHEAVAECAVIGAPDDERGTIVKAFVVLKPGCDVAAVTEQALQAHVKAAIAPYKYPRAIVFVDALPKTQTGKLQRYKLR
ncbi:AMP-binding protein [Maricaulis sp. W15]|uniref:AMP-binding protein n=1 Tax=Maricaulis sp. W15 TaxID=1772333 RepID=UPI000AE0275C|nr:AMP-binding protein [Maricaulis sp. W15]